MGTQTLEAIKAKIDIAATVANLLTDGTIKATAQIRLSSDESLTSGVSANQCDRAVKHEATITSGGTLTIDLYDFAGIDSGAGAGVDPVGQAVAFEEIMLIAIKSKSTSAGSLELSPNATNGWTPIGTHDVSTGRAIRAGGIFILYNPDTSGFAVTDGANHRIDLDANGGDVTFELLVLGRHDVDESSSSSSSSSQSSSSSSSS